MSLMLGWSLNTSNIPSTLAPGMPKTILTPALERESTITLARFRFDIATVIEF